MQTWLHQTNINIKVGWFLAVREIKRGNRWNISLIIFVMMLTFLNLVVVRGILVGLPAGVITANREQYTGDVFLTPLDTQDTIQNSPLVIDLIRQLPTVKTLSARYSGSAKIEANFDQTLQSDQLPDVVNGKLLGINPDKEDSLSQLSTYIVAGQYLSTNDIDQAILDTGLLEQYSTDNTGLPNVHIGDKLRLTVGQNTRVITVKGFLDTKAQGFTGVILMPDHQVQSMLNRFDYGINQIAIRSVNGTTPEQIKQTLNANQIDQYATIETYQESLPSFIQDIAATFSILGNIIGSIGLVVAAITVFIVIFVNAITRRKYIGILKGIGIHRAAIEWSYIFQSLFYATIGSLIATIIIFTLLIPYFDANPLDFPFSDGILLVTPGGTAIRAGLLLIATLAAGYFPARMVVNQNTLDSILGRQ